MKTPSVIFALALLWGFSANAQTELPDTLTVGRQHEAEPADSIENRTQRNTSTMMPEIRQPSSPTRLKTDNFDSREAASTVHNLRPGMATIGAWSTGSVNAVGSTASFPGMMGVESGMLLFSQRIGRFTVNGDVEAMKFGYFRGLRTVWGFGASLSYDISDRIGVTVFGSYYTKPKLYQPAMLGFGPSQSFGGYMSFDLGEHWGVDVGAQSIMQQNTRNYRFEPIVTPYYKFNKVKIGVNVGGILYNIFRSSRDGFRGNPTITPPVPGHGNNNFR